MTDDRLSEVAQQAIDYARSEIEKFGVPDMVLLDISLDKGVHIAESLGANVDLVRTGVALMDVKLGQAFKEKRLKEHVTMSIEAARDFLKPYVLAEEVRDVIFNAIGAHHGGHPFRSVEAEICANADCYRFIHPKGVFLYLTVLGKRLGDFAASLDQVETKMDEKMSIVSLPLVKDELAPIYDTFKEYLRLARE